MNKLFTKDIRKKETSSRLTRYLLLGLIILNSFANGWIALGDFTGLNMLIQWGIIANGSLVSFAVMMQNRSENYSNYY